MSESKHDHHHGKEEPGGIDVHHEMPPYWRHMHHDWRFWVGLLFMFAAITIYVATNNLSMTFRGGPQRPIPADVGP